MKNQEIEVLMQLLKEYKSGDLLKIVYHIKDSETLSKLLEWSKTTEQYYTFDDINFKTDRYTLLDELICNKRSVYSLGSFAMDKSYEYDLYYYVRMAIAENPYISEEIKLILAEDRNTYVKFVMLKRKDLTAGILEKMLQSTVKYANNLIFNCEDCDHRDWIIYLLISVLAHDKYTNKSLVYELNLSEIFNHLNSINWWKVACKFNLPAWKNAIDKTTDRNIFMVKEIYSLPKNVSSDKICCLYNKIKNMFPYDYEMYDIFFNIIDNTKIPSTVYDDFADMAKECTEYKRILILHPYASLEKMKHIYAESDSDFYIDWYVRVSLSLIPQNMSQELMEYIGDIANKSDKFIFTEDALKKADFSEFTENLIEKIYRYCIDEIACFVALLRNKTLPVRYLERASKLYKTKYIAYIQLALLDNPNCTNEVYKNIIEHSASYYIEKQAKNYLFY